MFQWLTGASRRIATAVIAAVVLLFAVGLIYEVNSYLNRPEPKAAVVSKVGQAAVNTIQKAGAREASGQTRLKEAIDNVKQTSHASDDLGDTGRAGLAALCGMQYYSNEARCQAADVQRAGARGVEAPAGQDAPAR